MQPDAAIVALADQPFITASLVNRLIDTYERNPGLDYVASTHEGLAMPPALFSKEMFTVLQDWTATKARLGFCVRPIIRGWCWRRIPPIALWMLTQKWILGRSARNGALGVEADMV